MAYEKNNWQSGDVITAEKLNHIEDGIANTGKTLVIGGFIGNADGNPYIGEADKTWQEIHDALVAGKECFAILHDGDMVSHAPIDRTWSSAGIYYISVYGVDAVCYSSDGYPTIPSDDDYS